MRLFTSNSIRLFFKSFLYSSTAFNSLNHHKLQILDFLSQSNFAKLHIYQPLFKIIPFNLSDIGEGIYEVVIIEWFVKEGDEVSQFQNLCQVQSDKATVTITSRYDGKIRKLYVREDEKCRVGSPLVDIEIEDVIQNKNVSVETKQHNLLPFSGPDIIESNPLLNSGTNLLASPLVRKLAREMKIDLSNVSASGLNGHVLKQDLYNSLSIKNNGTVVPFTNYDIGKVDFETNKQVQVVPLSNIQKVMFTTMTDSCKIPQFGYSDELQIKRLSQLKKDFSKSVESQDFNLTYMSLFTKITSIVLYQFPILNSTYDNQSQMMIIKNFHNIGIAMDTKEGLIVPNIKNVQRKSISEIAKDLHQLHNLGKDGLLLPSHLKGGTFTLSNIGSIGGTYLRPLLLPPEVCILSIGKIRKSAINNEEIINISFSADHRIIDGATVARFSNLWKNYVENPSLLALTLI